MYLPSGEGATDTTGPASTLQPADTLSSTTTSDIHESVRGEPIDSADWPTLSDMVRTELVSRGPYHTNPDFTSHKRQDGRRMNLIFIYLAATAQMYK